MRTRISWNERKATIGGVTRTWNEWVAVNGLSQSIVKGRESRGYTFEEAVTRPKGYQKTMWNSDTLTIDGEIRTLGEWCERYGLRRSVYYDRVYKYGWDPVEAMVRPPKTRKTKEDKL